MTSRREFLKLSAAALGGLALNHLRPGNVNQEGIDYALTLIPSRSETASLLRSIKTARINCGAFIQGYPLAVDYPSILVKHQQFRADFSARVPFDPLPTDYALLDGLEHDASDIVIRAVAQQTAFSNTIDEKLTREVEDTSRLKVKKLLRIPDNPELDESFADDIRARTPPLLTSRWQNYQAAQLYEPTPIIKDPTAAEVVTILQNAYSLPLRVSQRNIYVASGIARSDGEIWLDPLTDYVVAQAENFTQDEARRLVALSTAHEFTHGLDIFTNLDLLRYISKNGRLQRLYELRYQSSGIEEVAAAALKLKLIEDQTYKLVQQGSNLSLSEIRSYTICYAAKVLDRLLTTPERKDKEPTLYQHIYPSLKFNYIKVEDLRNVQNFGQILDFDTPLGALLEAVLRNHRKEIFSDYPAEKMYSREEVIPELCRYAGYMVLTGENSGDIPQQLFRHLCQIFAQAGNEYLAEAGQVHIFLSSGLAGKVDHNKIEELVLIDPRVRYVKQVLETLQSNN